MIFTLKNRISLEIDTNNFTARVVYSPTAKCDIIIPRFFNYKKQNYAITSITEGSFKSNHEIESISFEEESEIYKIEKNSFFDSSIKKIIFPPSLTEIEEGWNRKADKLTTVIISEKSLHFKYLDKGHHIIIGKSKTSNSNFDVLIFVNKNVHEIRIPSSITRINSFAFLTCSYLNSIEIPEDSKMLSIEKDAFYGSSVKRINISHRIEELKDGWCNFAPKLNSIVISEENKNFSYLNDERKVIMGKSKFSQNLFDDLVFASRKIRKISIPSFVRHICSYAFSECSNLIDVEFEENSELVSFGKYSFASALIKIIHVPKNVEIIEEGTFSFCCQLKSIQFCEDSKLRIIKKGAFESTLIENICFPSNVEELEDEWNKEMRKLKTISISEKNKNFSYLDDQHKIIVGKSEQSKDIFDIIISSCRDITEVIIPSYIKRINSYSFEKCTEIQRFEICENSELVYIGDGCFSQSSIEEFIVPSHVKYIGKFCFESCFSLNKFEFSKDSELLSIENSAFENSGIPKIKIPSKVKKIKKFSFQDCFNLTSIEFSDDSELESIGISSFAYSALQKIKIPSHVKKIGSAAFISSDIEEIEFSENSELCLIESQAFQFTKLKRIKIPDCVEKIDKYLFFGCQNLESVEFSENSELKIIEENSFSDSSIVSLSIPSKVEELNSSWCNNTPYFTQIFLSPKNENFLFYKDKMLIGKSQETKDTLYFVKHDTVNITIPSFVRHISSYCFSGCKKLDTIEFFEDSKLVSIDDCSFFGSSIQRLSIPSNVELLNDGWCNNTVNLTKVLVSSQNKRFSLVDDKMVVFNSNENEGILSFVNRDVECITIPSNIVQIGPWCFDECKQLKKVLFHDDSQLKIIQKNAFFNSKIEKIFIPNHVEIICEYAFNLCHNLKKVEFSKGSKLKIIKTGAFFDSFIDEIMIPSSVKIIEKNAFYSCINLKKFAFEENSQLESIEHQLFQKTQIKKIVIPKNVNLIKTNAFSNCQKLKCIEFLGDKLTVFDSVFKNCTNLVIISFPNAHEIILYDFIKGINNSHSFIYFMSGTKVTFNY